MSDLDGLSVYELAQRARECLLLGDPREAVAAAELATAREPSSASLQLLLGRACFGFAALGRAEEAFRRVLEIDPTDHYAHHLLGRTYERLSRLYEAKRHYHLAASLDPDPVYLEALWRVTDRLGRD